MSSCRAPLTARQAAQTLVERSGSGLEAGDDGFSVVVCKLHIYLYANVFCKKVLSRVASQRNDVHLRQPVKETEEKRQRFSYQ